MKRTIIGYGAVCALVVLAVSCASSGGGKSASQPEEPQPVKAAGPYQLPLSEFKDWYKASIEEDTITFEGGGLDYLLPLDVNLKAYSELVLVYETSDWVEEEAVAEKTGTANLMQLSIKNWDGGDGRVDLTYPYLQEGAGEVVLLDADKYTELQQKAVEGFSIAANVWENNGIANYKVKILSLELRP